MFDKYEVIKRLQNGETLGEIADSMTAALNDAANEYEKSKVNIEREKKISDMTAILDLVHDYLLDYYANNHSEIDTINKIFSDKMVEEVVDGIDASYKEINSFFDYIKLKEKPNEKKEVLKDSTIIPDVTVLNMFDADFEDQLYSSLNKFIKINKSK